MILTKSHYTLNLIAISTAACPQSSPWLCILPGIKPALASSCSSVRQVKIPKITGLSNSNCKFMIFLVTLSQMYSKCIVEPLIKTPIGMITSIGLPAASYWAKSCFVAYGNSKEPGTDSTMIFSSKTPNSLHLVMAPSTKLSMITLFHLACKIPTLNLEPDGRNLSIFITSTTQQETTYHRISGQFDPILSLPFSTQTLE